VSAFLRAIFVALAVASLASGPALAGKNKTVKALTAAASQIEAADEEKSARLQEALDKVDDLKANVWKMPRNQFEDEARALFKIMNEEVRGWGMAIQTPHWL